MRPLSESTLREVAKMAAEDEVKRLGVHVTPYVIGRIVEVVRAIFAGQPVPNFAAIDAIGQGGDDDIVDAEIIDGP